MVKKLQCYLGGSDRTWMIEAEFVLAESRSVSAKLVAPRHISGPATVAFTLDVSFADQSVAFVTTEIQVIVDQVVIPVQLRVHHFAVDRGSRKIAHFQT